VLTRAAVRLLGLGLVPVAIVAVDLDDLLQVLDAELGEGDGVFLAGSMDSDQAIFRLEFAADVVKPVLVLAYPHRDPCERRQAAFAGRLRCAFFLLCRSLHKRKNALFAGHDEGGRSWARLASLIATCKLNGVEPFAYMKATLEAIAAGHPQSRVDELLPWNFPATPGPYPQAA